MASQATRSLFVPLVIGCLIWGCDKEPPKPVEVETLKPSTPDVAPPPIATPPPLDDDSAVVVSVIGNVEIRRGDKPVWDPAKVGDKVAANDSVRTGDAADLEMSVGEARVRVKEHTAVKVKKVNKSGLRAHVQGHMEADVKPNSGASVELEADGSDTVLTTKGGEVAMIADGAGVVSVAAKSGVATLQVAGKEKELKQGETSRIVDDKVAKEGIEELLLAVNWPGAPSKEGGRETNKGLVNVEGRATPGSRVFVAGTVAKVDKKGHFVAKVSLKQGRQKLAVVVRDVRGMQKEAITEIVSDRHNQIGDVKTEWGQSH